MKAIQLKEYGGPDVLKLVEMDVPEPRGHEVLIQIRSIGVNYADTARREGQYVVKTPLPFIPGAEVAGVVKAVGEKSDIVPGTRVVALIESGGYSEFAIADSRGLIPIPEGLDFHEAAALPLQGLSAYHILKTMGRLQKGENVLVHAAAGGVGTLAVQLARIFGAGKIIATASSEQKLRLARDMGADVLVDYTESGWEEKVREATEGKGVDLALEMAGGEVFAKTMKCLAPFGRVVVYGVASGEQYRMYPSSLMARNQSVIGFFLPQIMKMPELLHTSMKELLGYLAEGKLKLAVGGIYPLEEASFVHEQMQGRKTSGKLILTP
ncbi:quinone oxidoreductase family protein [Bacillus infantis]|uniref:NADPH:quinone oxidoreductase family protein n=1 Tax=Bacillus infantis TaxID=324767 RepID=A0A5D4R895_9BACI|nr:NADPH:quinone oxidoreductase family protein [Bacillus infantis]TYS46274.1 NADPH:quinone oxidoreductase family protein [Bacillus infantis]